MCPSGEDSPKKGGPLDDASVLFFTASCVVCRQFTAATIFVMHKSGHRIVDKGFRTPFKFDFIQIIVIR